MKPNRPRRAPSLCVRKDGRLYATDPATKKPVYFRREGDYEAWRSAFLARRPGEPSRPVGPGATVYRLADGYLQFAQKEYRKNGRPTSTVGKARLAVRVLTEACGPRLAESLRAADLEAMQARMVEEGLARSTINSVAKVIVRIFRWGVTTDAVTDACLGRLRSVGGLRKGRTAAREPAKVRPVDMATLEATLAFVRPAVRAMAMVQYYGGARPGDVVILRPCDVDRSAPVWVYRPHTYKTEHHDAAEGRRVWFGPKAQAILGPLLDAAADPEAYLFRSRRGRRYSTTTYHGAISAGCERAGAPHWSPNRLRHAQATEVRKRFGLEGSQVFLGQESAKVAEMYAETDADLARKIAAELG